MYEWVGSTSLNINIGGHYVCTPAWTTAQPLRMPEYRMYFTQKGEARVVVDGESYTLRGGAVYFIPGSRPIANVCDRRLELDWLHFKPDSLYVDLLLQQISAVHRWPASRWAQWEPLYRRMAELFFGRDAALFLQMQAMLLLLVSDLIQTQVPGGFEALNVRVKELQPALSFMDTAYKRNPPLQEIAATVFLSPIYFHRRFTSALGVTPHAYMERKRMARARNLLHTSSLSVSEIARECGYDNAFYFSRAFKKSFGSSPLKMRRRGGAEMP